LVVLQVAEASERKLMKTLFADVRLLRSTS
jgi:hypothetical protein